jgi:AraC-like DNA-binding protein
MDGGSPIPRWISQAIVLIESDIRKHLTIRELAAKVGTNSYSLKRVFKEIYGMGPYEYLLEVRLKKASELLLLTDHPIKTISRQVGYRSPSSFVAMFKRKNKLSPQLWRNNKIAEKNNSLSRKRR